MVYITHKFVVCFMLLIASAFGNDKNTDERTGEDLRTQDHMIALGSQPLNGWVSNRIIAPSARVPSRTAVLIIAPPNLVHHRWQLGKKLWEQYMNSNPAVDCYFLQTTSLRRDKDESDQVWIEGNTIYVGDVYQEKYGNDRILYKTIAALKYIAPYYTHFIRTNLNTFFNLSNVSSYMETHSASMFTTPFWQGEWYALGYSIIFTRDVAEHIVKEYERIKKVNPYAVSDTWADDCLITALATGVFPLERNHHFRVCPSLDPAVRQLMCKDGFSADRINQYGVFLLPPISLRSAIQYCEQAGNTPILYRNREGFTLEELARLYEYLLKKNYPKINHVNLGQYVNSLK